MGIEYVDEPCAPIKSLQLLNSLRIVRIVSLNPVMKHSNIFLFVLHKKIPKISFFLVAYLYIN